MIEHELINLYLIYYLTLSRENGLFLHFALDLHRSK